MKRSNSSTTPIDRSAYRPKSSFTKLNGQTSSLATAVESLLVGLEALAAKLESLEAKLNTLSDKPELLGVKPESYRIPADSRAAAPESFECFMMRGL